MPKASSLTEDQVRVILESRQSNASLAREFGCSGEMIRRVRFGRNLAHVLPDIPRWEAPVAGGTSCLACLHWDRQSQECDLGFPDPIEEGLGFARDCHVYKARV